jgi:hypothetical protein
MSDTIRAALEAAHWQASSFYALSETAEMIATFLRQMDPVALGDGFTFASLADAVERAAKQVGP